MKGPLSNDDVHLFVFLSVTGPILLRATPAARDKQPLVIRRADCGLVHCGLWSAGMLQCTASGTADYYRLDWSGQYTFSVLYVADFVNWSWCRCCSVISRRLSINTFSQRV